MLYRNASDRLSTEFHIIISHIVRNCKMDITLMSGINLQVLNVKLLKIILIVCWWIVKLAFDIKSGCDLLHSSINTFLSDAIYSIAWYFSWNLFGDFIVPKLIWWIWLCKTRVKLIFPPCDEEPRIHYSDKSPDSRLLTQLFIQAQIKENIKAPRHWLLCGDFTGDVSIWWRHHNMSVYK